MIDVGKDTIKFTSPPCNHHEFPKAKSKGKSKGKRGRRKPSSDINASSLENT
jgi:hypothetical protein